ncbi:MAG: family 43 glycosylhydrolase [Oscillospiraceae bacterium]|nr:family 43 glycosylhydrolase [Oscillospiraceae bacterium]
MRTKIRIIISVLLLTLLLSACGAAASLPSESTASTENLPNEAASPAAGVPDEPYEAVDYTLYPAPDGGYVGDVMPYVTEDGTLELYYLFDTDRNGQGYHPIYKYSTTDLCGYKDHGMVLNYGQMSDPDPALGTGSVLQDPDGLYHFFYTGHTSIGNSGKGTECVMHATSTDREVWVKDPDILFNAPEGYSGVDFRDPEVFWVERDQCYWLLMSATAESMSGVVVKYTSMDLKNWEFQGPFFTPYKHYMCECPDLFCIGDTWYLTYSWDCVTYYAMSDSMDGPFVAPQDNILDGKGLMDGNGFIFYAAKTAEIDGHVYLCGWLGRAGMSSDSGFYQWAGNIMNHELVQNEDKTLGVKAPETLDSYFTIDKLVFAEPMTEGVEINDNNISLSPDADSYALADMGTRPATMTLECDVTFDAGGCVGFAFGGSASDETYTALCLDGGRNLLHYEGYEIEDIRDFDPMAVTKFDFSRADSHHVKLVCENEIVVLYIDDMKALSSRITHSIDGAHIGVFADGCSAEFSNISVKIPG